MKNKNILNNSNKLYINLNKKCSYFSFLIIEFYYVYLDDFSLFFYKYLRLAFHHLQYLDNLILDIILTCQLINYYNYHLFYSLLNLVFLILI